MDRLLQQIARVDSRGDLSSAEVAAVDLDSRQVTEGSLFCCVRGAVSDGHDHAAEAVRRGAVALLVERFVDVDVPQVVLPEGEVRRIATELAISLHGDPSKDLEVVGVTGTNGKTTVTHLLAAIFEEHGWQASVIGTLGGARTTPEAPVLQRLLASARDRGKRAVALEVSSHALALGRVDGLRMAAAVFTNLGRDHLDFHRTMEEYFAAKASLFTSAFARIGVVNEDDPYGRRILRSAKMPLVAVSARQASGVERGGAGISFTWRGQRVSMRLRGGFNVANALLAAATASALGVAEETVAAGLSKARPVPGRFEVVPAGLPFDVVVDYAHTPDALEAALLASREQSAGGRVLCVFGCGGNRDREKRPEMGAVAAELADVVVVTSDNPRDEDPRAIIEQVLAGAEEVVARIPRKRSPDGGGVQKPPVVVLAEPDRRRAIEVAVERALPGDVVLVAGKGHETVIESHGTTTEFDDRVEAKEAARRVQARRSGAGT
jgi:UDP-N-acetylmuramoyl-L-alanyl-D-glutamate--2,6-diaminopimelate ligase